MEKVPWTGWKEISLTAYTRAWSLALGAESRRWHLNEKLLLFDDELYCVPLYPRGKFYTYWASFSSTYLHPVMLEGGKLGNIQRGSLDGYPTLDATHCKATVDRRSCETRNNTRLPLQR